MSGNASRGVLNELLRIAEGMYAAADIRTKPFRLEHMELSALYSLRAGSARQGKRDTAFHVALEILRREVRAAQAETSTRPYDRAVLALEWLLWEVAKQHKGTRRSAAAMTRDLVRAVNAHPKWLENVERGAAQVARSNHVKVLTGLTTKDWNAFVAQVLEESDRRQKPALERISAGAPQEVDLNVASRLSRVAAREKESASSELPTYDTSERNVRIAWVTVTGFRGSTSTVTVDFTKNGKPADVLLWGDNGVGKSTIVDGIEFALQRRVDRSADFNSSLRSAVRNLSVPTAHAEVGLSDGSIVERSLIVNKARRDEPSSLEVRPGFRIAPLVIRRTDILRFLDTDALSRGTVFFDYFPDPKGTLGERPDEELKMLEEERFLLRVARDDLAGQLSELYPDAGTDFTNSARLEKFVRGLLEEIIPEEIENPQEEPLPRASPVPALVS